MAGSVRLVDIFGAHRCRDLAVAHDYWLSVLVLFESMRNYFPSLDSRAQAEQAWAVSVDRLGAAIGEVPHTLLEALDE